MFKNAVRHFSYVEKEQKKDRRGKERSRSVCPGSSRWVRTGLAEKGAPLWSHLKGPERPLSQWDEASSCNGTHYAFGILEQCPGPWVTQGQWRFRVKLLLG